MIPFVFKAVGYLGWLLTTALGVAGWFWNFTEPDPTESHRKRLTRAGRKAVFAMMISAVFSVVATTYSEISSYYSGKEQKTENERLQAKIEALEGNLGKAFQAAMEGVERTAWSTTLSSDRKAEIPIRLFGETLYAKATDEIEFYFLEIEKKDRITVIESQDIKLRVDNRDYKVAPSYNDVARVRIAGRDGTLMPLTILNPGHVSFTVKVTLRSTYAPELLDLASRLYGSQSR